MFFQHSALPPGYNMAGGPFVTLNLPYHQAAPPPPPPPPPVGHAYQTPGMGAAAASPTPAAAPAYHRGGGRATSASYSKDSSTTSFPSSNPAQSHISESKRINGNRKARDQSRQSVNGLTSVEPSPGMVPSCGWGLSVPSLPNSAASSMTTPPIYVLLQQGPPQYQQVSPSLGCMAGGPAPPPPPPPPPPLPSRTPLVAPQYQLQENGSMYELGEWYEGLVKRYNPMRGFGFLTATHHLQVLSSPPPPPPPPPSSSSSTSAVDTSGKVASTNPEVAVSGECDAALANLRVRMVRTPVSLGDIFVHQSYIQMQGFRALAVGDKVVFRIGVLQGKHAHQAVSVQQIGGTESNNNGATVGGSDVCPPTGGTPTEHEQREEQEDEEEQKKKKKKDEGLRQSAEHQHTNVTVQQLLQRLAVKEGTSDVALGGTTAACSANLSAEELSEECIESCCLPSPFFNRNTVALEPASTACESEAPSPAHATHDMAPLESDEVYDFLAPFDEK